MAAVLARSTDLHRVRSKCPASTRRRRLAIVASLVGVLGAARADADLAAYLAAPDTGAGAEVGARSRVDGGEALRIRLVSQQWRGAPWTHALAVYRPERPTYPDVALLVVAAGADADVVARVGRETGTTVAMLGDVPNQPLLGGRYEDDLVAETFTRYLRSGEPDWPLLLPMTKSGVRAMDALQRLDPALRRFVVTGASKRGWTTWLAGAFDARVAGIVPVVFDNLHFAAQLPHQVATWGRHSSRIRDYTSRGLAGMVETPRGRELVADVDPWSHRERLARVRKLIVNGTNDPYWTVDALRLYWDDLGGEKSVVYVPNGGHGIAGDARVRSATVAFVARVAEDRPMPRLDVSERDGAIAVAPSEQPRAARAWCAQSASGDFTSARWSAAPLDARDVRTPLPAEGRACFVELDFAEGDRGFSLATPMAAAR